MTQPKPSKSARKREQLALQQLGEQLIGLPDDELQALPIEERLREAVIAASKLRSHGALRRQKQLIGKLMRQCDPEPIRHALEARAGDERRAKRLFAEAERWRDRIAGGGGDDVHAFCERSGADAAPLEELLRGIRGAPNERSEKTLRRQLFRDIHDALMAAAQDDRISR